jgi:competence protein ComEA
VISARDLPGQAAAHINTRHRDVKQMQLLERYYRPLAAVIVVALVSGAIILFSRQAEQPPVQITQVPTPEATPQLEMKVYVSGEVQKPGVYSVAVGSRIQDAIQAAGGILPGADVESINLAKRLSDEDHVHVPAEGESPALISGDAGSPLINLNEAAESELETLPGIGPVLAEAIVRYRSTNGAFKSIDDLSSVPGIGPKLIERIKDLVTIQ